MTSLEVKTNVSVNTINQTVHSTHFTQPLPGSTLTHCTYSCITLVDSIAVTIIWFRDYSGFVYNQFDLKTHQFCNEIDV